MADNPYALVGTVATGPHFVERRRPGGRIGRTWRHAGVRPGNLSVLGHHRTGKSSLVHWAADQCTRPDLQTVFIDVGTLTSGQDLFRSLVRETLVAMEYPAGLVPIGAAALEAKTWGELLYAVHAFFTAVREDGRYVMIVLDEFDRASRVCQQLAEFQLLRNLASENYSTGLITISRRRVADIEIDAAGGSILDGVLTLKQHVGMFTSGEGNVMLERAMSVGVDLSPFSERIVDLTGLHPYLLELLCYSIVDLYQDTGEIDVDRAYQEEIGTFRDHFDRLAEAVKTDLGEKGIALVQDLAKGIVPAQEYLRELDQCRDFGLVSQLDGRPVLFALSFARHVLTL